jgi:hypothetical protein
MCGEDPIKRLAHWREHGVLQRTLRECRSVSGREQELVSLPERDLELLGNPQ